MTDDKSGKRTKREKPTDDGTGGPPAAPVLGALIHVRDRVGAVRPERSEARLYLAAFVALTAIVRLFRAWGTSAAAALAAELQATSAHVARTLEHHEGEPAEVRAAASQGIGRDLLACALALAGWRPADATLTERIELERELLAEAEAYGAAWSREKGARVKRYRGRAAIALADERGGLLAARGPGETRRGLTPAQGERAAALGIPVHFDVEAPL